MNKIKMYQKPSSCRLSAYAVDDGTEISAGMQRGFDTKSQFVAEAKRLNLEIVNLDDFNWKKD
jgi:hypothetical protein